MNVICDTHINDMILRNVMDYKVVIEKVASTFCSKYWYLNEEMYF